MSGNSRRTYEGKCAAFNTVLQHARRKRQLQRVRVGGRLKSRPLQDMTAGAERGCTLRGCALPAPPPHLAGGPVHEVQRPLVIGFLKAVQLREPVCDRMLCVWGGEWRSGWRCVLRLLSSEPPALLPPAPGRRSLCEALAVDADHDVAAWGGGGRWW